MQSALQRSSKRMFITVFVVSLLLNIFLLSSSGGQCIICEPCRDGNQGSDHITHKNNVDSAAGNTKPINSPLEAVDETAVPPPILDEEGIANLEAPASYVKHGLRSVYDPKSPVHTIVSVSGVGPMIAVATPVWRLVSYRGDGKGPVEEDNVAPPGQIVGEEAAAPPAKSIEAESEGNGSGRKLLSSTSPSEGTSIDAGNLKLWIPKDVTRISIDVGTFLTSPSSKRWWYWDKKAMVVAFEPNIVSGMLLTRISHPAFNTQLHGYWPTCPLPSVGPNGEASNAEPKTINRQVQLDNLAECLNKSYGHITSHMDRFVLFPVALSNSDYYANFQYGFPGRADSGSLLNFNRQMIKKRQGAKPLFGLPTPIMKMASILSLIPTVRADGTPILWDTLKIDAQGVDSLIIEGAGHLLRNFACILGEFDYSSYKGVKKFDYRAYLVYELGFIMTKKTTFINPSLASVVHEQKALCFSSDVAVDYGHLGRTMAKMRAEGKLPKQREHPELQPIKRG